MIKPTIGRVVWFWPSYAVAQPYAALIAFVHSDAQVNLAVFDGRGVGEGLDYVILYQGIGERPSGRFCEWMPYQQGQAAKAETLEKQLADLSK